VNGFLSALAIDVLSGLISAVIGGIFASYFVGGSTEVRPIVLDLDISPVIIVSGTGSPAPAPESTSPPLGCTDAKGQKGVFRAMVFLDSYNWVRGSSELVEFNGETIPYFPTVLRQEPVQKLLAGAQEIVAVGTASCESPWGALVENRRAEQRAKQLVRWVEESRDRLPQHPNTPMRSVRALSLGRYTKDCSAPAAAETARQRPIILIAVAERQEGLDLESCLQRKMKEDDSLKFLTENYSRFDLDPDH
jgi:hypothetical protein